MYPPSFEKSHISRHRRRRQAGFTLIELAVVVVIIGVFASLALPQITRQMRDRRVAQAAQDVVNFYRQARLRAMGRGGAVNVRYVPGSGGHGQLTMQDAVIGGGTAAACGEMPSSSCGATNWTNNDASDVATTARLVAEYDAASDAGIDDVYVHMFLPSTGAAVANGVEICFTPMGRTFIREGAQSGAFSAFTSATGGVLRAEIRRRVGSSGGATIGLIREFTMLPSGVARVASRAP